MTVHGSKGLEFPVVFLARLSGPFSTEDSRQRLLLHDAAGIGLRLRDEETRTKHTTLPFMGVQSARLQDSRAEELRVWYVALTRAREKLIMVYTAKDLRKTLWRLEVDLPEEQAVPSASLLYAASPGEWMLAAALRHPDFRGLRQLPDRTASLPSEKPWRVEVIAPTAAEEQVEEEKPAVAPADEALVTRLKERLDYRYPYEALGGVPAKLAASQLSHEQMSREYIARSRPTFMEKEGMTAAQRGTALHTFMQFADYEKAAADVGTEARRLVEAGFLTPRQGEALPADKLNGFFASELYRRMAASADCRREYHFAVTVEAGSLTDLPADMAVEPVVVQGIADCVFVEDGRLILVDYKTDRVKTPEELAERYHSQMRFYQQALELLLGCPVGQILLYSFHLQQTVEIPV